jgi:hypothetical protein
LSGPLSALFVSQEQEQEDNDNGQSSNDRRRTIAAVDESSINSNNNGGITAGDPTTTTTTNAAMLSSDDDNDQRLPSRLIKKNIMANAVWVEFVIDNEDDSYDAFRIKTTVETNIVDDMRKVMVVKMPESSSRVVKPLRPDRKLSNPGSPSKTM